MILVMNHRAGDDEIEAVIIRLEKLGFQIHLSRGVERTIIGAIGDKGHLIELDLEAMPGVEKVVPILRPYKLASRTFHEEGTVIRVGNLEIGGETVHVMAGPCAVESREQLLSAARIVKEAGATILRGGAYKPRTSPYSFQGLEEEGLELLAEARAATGLLIVTEVMDAKTLPVVAQYADILQIGARNMQNFFLLREVAKIDKPVVLKRGPSATIEEWLMAAEYIMSGGNYNVILCERGIRSFETYTRNTLDLTSVPVVKHLSHLPVIVDPSHAIGKWRFVTPMARAAIAAGADGLMIEVHPNPIEALCDGPQSLTPENFAGMMADLRRMVEVTGRKMP
ncbi:3-deoxy-7-phosphoheptulonate synthase [Pelotomaculum propionicicum]|uniref:Phospho-2-dehydro-3-deoxyheptonate aldolase n=1 Tax=Pelotomaculum propionicicum TaxID=258475 RepID=A0A4Y7RS36_9FIRM|nr:3-deoxy-7-phosphoheptulonate synthase [Pelotomaculum propionicicum]NLI11908.1 3-deoxy-7-phosphoheptulonate synthase [Peptococcaceae bacterium]TEB11808.1 Phospho-2-dehydro-3-deoxyheptonate aldolase [Pelotomaculum propionicicum]